MGCFIIVVKPTPSEELLLEGLPGREAMKPPPVEPLRGMHGELERVPLRLRCGTAGGPGNASALSSSYS